MRSRTSTSHERLEREGPATGSDRSFGIVFTVAFAVFSAFAAWRGSNLWIGWALAASIIFILAIHRPAALNLLNRAWHRFGLILGKITTPIVLGFLYYGTIVTTGLLLRIAGKDLLRLRWDAKATSYWIHRDPPGPEPSTMNRQF